ncbi:hypothetical protein [Spirosoma panaciterrae]|uniref:hypothetical protein n=1 Tax=Spirosoma panaciterrae TaxID=496058 RepID=UPI000378A883|nr:hypothetical protein [Spirosoma panaciterrae]
MPNIYYQPSSFESRYAQWTSPDRVAIGFAGLILLYGVFFIRNFSGPLASIVPGDTDQWDYIGYYFAKNLSFNPFPHLNLLNDKTFYPYGTNHVFQSWAFEQDYWYAGWYQLLGNGPWLNIYYLISLFLLSFGPYVLLRTDYGNFRATLAGLFICFFNFYALNKYPGHFTHAVIHWTVLSILTDFLLTRRVVLQERVSLRFLLLKILLLTLCLGHDMTYMAGYALSSFTITSLFVTGLLGWRLVRSPKKPGEQVSDLVDTWRVDLQKPLIPIGLLLTVAVVGFLYLPLLVQIVQQTQSFVFKDRFANGHGWVHPLRLLTPYLPGFDPVIDPLGHYLHDMPEGYGAGGAGWFLLFLGLLGFWTTRKPIRWAYVPLLVFGLIHALYHPIRIPTLQIFPWDRFNRMPSRVTITYPVILVIFALHWSGRVRPAFLAVWVLIGLVEAFSVYQYRYSQQPYYYSASFKAYIDRIRQQPGEAILDWPFCLIGGNSVGLPEGLCPLYNRTNMLYALQRFHNKKTIGHYFGRLHESQIKPFIQAGWPALLNHPDTSSIWEARQLTTCLTTEQWRFFKEFYQANDFAGINLCIDLLPKSCVDVFYQQMGRPVAATEVPGAGHVVFIPKSAAMRQKVNRLMGQLVRFPCGCPLNP